MVAASLKKKTTHIQRPQHDGQHLTRQVCIEEEPPRVSEGRCQSRGVAAVGPVARFAQVARVDCGNIHVRERLTQHITGVKQLLNALRLSDESGAANHHGIGGEQYALPLQDRFAVLIKIRLVHQVMVGSRLGLHSAHAADRRVHVSPVPQYVHLLLVFRKCTTNCGGNTLAEHGYRIRDREQSAQQVVFVPSQSVHCLRTLKVKAVQSDYLWDGQLPEHLNESDAVSPDSELVLEPQDLVRALRHASHYVPGRVDVVAGNAIPDRVNLGRP